MLEASRWSLTSSVAQAQLPTFLGVFQAPRSDDAPVDDAEELHLGHVLEAASSRRVAKPCAGMCARAGEPTDDGLSRGDEFHNPHVHIAGRDQEGLDPPPRCRREPGGVQGVQGAKVTWFITSSMSRLTTCLGSESGTRTSMIVRPGFKQTLARGADSAVVPMSGRALVTLRDTGEVTLSERLPAFRRIAAGLQIRIEVFARCITTPTTKG